MSKENISIKIAAPVGWFSGWMFAIGFAQLSFGKAVLALFIWPYYIGVHCG